MKKSILILIFSTLYSFSFARRPSIDRSKAFIDGNLIFLMTSDSTANVLAHTPLSSSMIIPEKVMKENKTYTITAIMEGAFMCANGCKKKGTDYINISNKVVIPNTVTKIERYAFSNCMAKNINLSQNITKIEDGTFNEAGIKKIKIPYGVTSIGVRAFKACWKLKKVEIPETVEYIGHEAFYWCTNLKKVNISNGVKIIGEQAFENCKKLTKVYIPNSVTYIGSYAFYECENLEVIIDNKEGNVQFSDEKLYGCKSVTYLRK